MQYFCFIFLLTHSVFAQTKADETNKIFDFDLAFKSTNYASKNFKGLQFPILNISDINGQNFNSQESKRLVFYNFWHQGCSPCITEIEMLNQLMSIFKDDVDFIGITFNSKEDIINFNTVHNFEFRHISIDSNKITSLFIYNGYPASFLVFDGEIIEFSEGGFSNKESIYFSARMYNTYSKFRKAIEEKLKEIK